MKKYSKEYMKNQSKQLLKKIIKKNELQGVEAMRRPISPKTK